MKDSIAKTVSMVVQAGAMTAGRPIGGTIKIPDLVPVSGNSELLGVTIQDGSNLKVAMTILFFSTNFTTAPVDNAAWTPAAADLANCLGKVEIVAGDYTSVGAGPVAIATKNLTEPFVVAAADGGTVYAVALTGGTPAYATGLVGFVFHARRVGS